MELFVYSWFYNGYTVYGHCLDDEYNYTLLKVLDFYPSCYVEGETVPSSATVPFEVEYKRMLSSRDISTLKPFYRLFFRNAKELTSFSYEQRNCYMADIPQIATFLSQINADYVGWVEVPRQYSNEVNVSMKNICPLLSRVSGKGVSEKIPLPGPRVMAFDIEVRSMDLGMPQPYRITDAVEMISVVMFGGGKHEQTYIMHTLDKPLEIDAVDILCDDEMGLIIGFFDLMKHEDPTVITGFNIYGFDIHYLVSRLKLRLVEIPDVSKGTKNAVDLIRVDWASDAYGHNSYDRLVIGGRVIIDMYLYFKRMKLDKYSLDFVSEKFLGDRKNDMPHATMAKAFISRDYETLREVAKYCIQDSVLVMKLFEKVQMWIDVCEVSKITRCAIEDIYTRGEQMKMVAQCVAECTKRNIVLQPQYPSEWKQYEGAYVLEPVKGVYNGCSILDFQSLYPSIIIAYNICPSTYTKSFAHDTVCIETTDHRFKKHPVGLLPGMIKRILDERKAVKSQMAGMVDSTSVEYVVLDRRQNALKICANSVYGMMGFKNSRYFGHLGCAESVTTVGRILLSEIVDKIESTYPVQVVYGDTDSCMLWHKGSPENTDFVQLARSICDDVTASLPEPMALKFETYCDKVILLTKKRYILVTGDKISYKGVMNARRDYCKFAKDIYGSTMEMIAKGRTTEEIESYIDEKIMMLLCGKVKTSDLVITKSLARKLSTYKVNQPHVVLARRLVQKTGIDVPAGTRLEYIYVDDPDIPMVTPEEFENDSYRADGMFYVSKQLATQVDDVLSAVGMGSYIKESWLQNIQRGQRR